MDNLIDNSYFWGTLKLTTPTATALTGTPSQRSIAGADETLNMYIARFQKEFLTKLFGSNVAPDDYLPVLVIDSIKQSAIANYTFCRIASIQPELVAGSQYKKEGNEINIPYVNSKIVDAWNEMVDVCRAIRQTIITAGEDATYPTNYNDEIYNHIW